MKALVSDVLVVGGGPAGLAAAIALRQRGIDVLLADAVMPPIDKACGEGIMPDSRRELTQLGVDLTSANGILLRGIRFCDDRSTVSADFPSNTGSSDQGIGLRRLTLHSLLVERARELGVRMRWGTPVSLTPGQPLSLAGEPITYRYLVGADGQSSRVRAWAGLDRGTLHTRRFGFRMHYRTEPWSPYVEVHWGPLGQAYVTPVAEDEICVATVTRSATSARTSQVVESIPALREKLRHVEVTSRERGSITTTRTLRRVVRGNVALLGDASGSADAITGEGLAMAFRQAILLADAIDGGNLTSYATGHASTLRLPQLMGRVLLLMDRSPVLRRRALSVFAHDPELFKALLRVHLGEEPLNRFVLRYAPCLGCRMLQPSPLRS
ncbi:MAG TPA: FAD-dependent monooxygenase [Silvibacterium sp.]|jgi:flavin-dependent dehydrogenase|nr:FAD-dependent monooxygenase [Silvibacterium sp.]